MSEPFYRSLEHWAALAPDETVLIDGDHSLTYRQWNDIADALAAGFQKRGLGPGDIVVARTHNRIEWALISSATAKIGARLLIQNWRLTPAETRYVLENARANAFICDDPDPALLAEALTGLTLKLRVSLDFPVPGFERFDALIDAGAPPLFARANPPLIVYTSGTTGFPKGVEMPKPDPPLASTRDAPKREQGAGLVAMPVHHGSGANQIWNYLGSGRRIVLMRKFDPEEALAMIERHRITHFNGVPTMYKRMAGLASGTIQRYDLSSLKAISIGAAPCPWPLKEWIMDTFGEILSEGYGSTETSMITNMPPEWQRRKPGSSGLPYPNVEIEIRDSLGAKLGPNEEGDIWVRSPLTIDAYVNSPKLATDTRDAAGFFKVGDVGRIDEDGFLFITDRAKDMIISGGVNIYPAEIETALLTHPAVQDCAVLGGSNDEFGEEVWAYVELKPGRAATAADLAAHIAPRIASYKLPRRIEFIAELPRNTMGKILKRELRAPLWEGRTDKITSDILDLKGRIALITGAGQGVGRAAALHFANHNAGGVIVNDFFKDRAEAVAEEVRALGCKAVPIQCDVTKLDLVKAMAAQGERELGPISILVNNAGNAGAEPTADARKPFWETTPEDWDSFIRVNFYGVINCTAAVVPGMIERKAGRITTVISDAGRMGDAGLEVYAGAKAGAAGFMRATARALGRHGIAANCVAIAATFTPPIKARLEKDPERLKKIMQSYVIRRPGEPEDVANMILYLSSDAASWITGQTYPVNGGYTFSL